MKFFASEEERLQKEDEQWATAAYLKEAEMFTKMQRKWREILSKYFYNNYSQGEEVKAFYAQHPHILNEVDTRGLVYASVSIVLTSQNETRKQHAYEMLNLFIDLGFDCNAYYVKNNNYFADDLDQSISRAMPARLLHLAFQTFNGKLINLLLDANANLFLESSEGKTPLTTLAVAAFKEQYKDSELDAEQKQAVEKIIAQYLQKYNNDENDPTFIKQLSVCEQQGLFILLQAYRKDIDQQYNAIFTKLEQNLPDLAIYSPLIRHVPPRPTHPVGKSCLKKAGISNAGLLKKVSFLTEYEPEPKKPNSFRTGNKKFVEKIKNDHQEPLALRK